MESSVNVLPTADATSPVGIYLFVSVGRVTAAAKERSAPSIIPPIMISFAFIVAVSCGASKVISSPSPTSIALSTSPQIIKVSLPRPPIRKISISAGVPNT